MVGKSDKVPAPASSSFSPFENESDVLLLGDLTLENRIDRISLYGSIDLTLDQAGMRDAETLLGILTDAVAKMNKHPLPANIESIAPTLGESPL